MDMSKLVKPEFMPEAGTLYPVCSVLRNASEVLESADRTPDEEVKKDLVSGAVKMLQNVIDALQETPEDPENDDD